MMTAATVVVTAAVVAHVVGRDASSAAAVAAMVEDNLESDCCFVRFDTFRQRVTSDVTTWIESIVVVL